MAIQRLEQIPSREQLAENQSGFMMVSFPWLKFFDHFRAMFNNMVPSVGDDIGNADATLTWGKSALTQVSNSPLSAGRTITLPATGMVNGAKYRVVRTAAATGAFNLSVGGLKNLTAGQWCDVEYNGSAWFLTAFGSL